MVERIFAPSPRCLPMSVRVKGLPFCAPRGCRSVITGWAEMLDAETVNAETIQSKTRHLIAHLRTAVQARSSFPTCSPSHYTAGPDRRIHQSPRACYLGKTRRHRYL